MCLKRDRPRLKKTNQSIPMHCRFKKEACDKSQSLVYKCTGRDPFSLPNNPHFVKSRRCFFLPLTLRPRCKAPRQEALGLVSPPKSGERAPQCLVYTSQRGLPLSCRKPGLWSCRDRQIPNRPVSPRRCEKVEGLVHQAIAPSLGCQAYVEQCPPDTTLQSWCCRPILFNVSLHLAYVVMPQQGHM